VGFVDVNGLRLCYESSGDPADPTLLLIHGHGAQLIAWDDRLVGALVGLGLHVIRFDNRDAGLSTHLSWLPAPDVFSIAGGDLSTLPYAIEDLADDAAGLLEAVGHPTAHVLGISMGGMVAQSLAIRHPDATLSLTSVMSSPDPLHVGSPTDEVMATMFEEGATTRAGVVDQALASWRRTGSPRLGIDEAWVADHVGRAFDRSFDPDGVTRQFAAIVGSPDRRPGLAQVTVPTLVVHGDADPIVTVPGGAATAGAVPGATYVVVEDMGHDLPQAMWPQLLESVAAVTGVSEPSRR
jgi:pimeloyl-ACP methyl ester carboxylesterase